MDRRALLKGIVVAGGAATTLGALPASASAKKVAPTDAVGMLYDSTRCIGCKACVVKCREVNGLPPDVTPEDGGLHDLQTDLDANTKTVIKLYQERKPEQREATVEAYMKAQCMHCIDPACVSVCMIGALQKRDFGVVTWEKDLCVGCRYCQVGCPFGVPKFEFAEVSPKIVKCEMCVDRLRQGKEPGCTEVCPREAVIFGKLEDLKKEAHARIDANPELYQPKVYGEHDAGGTQVLYLSAVPFEKLGLPDLGDEGVPVLSEKVTHGIMQGLATPAVLYAALGAVIWRNHKKQDHHDEEGER